MPFCWIYLLPVLPASVLARDDFRTRRVGIGWLGALAVAAAVAAWQGEELRGMLLRTLCNALLLLVLLGALALWFGVRHRMPPRRLFVSGFGAGDCALLLAAAPLFVPAAYVRFLLAGCLAALVWWLCLRPRRRRTIPLAGFLALVLIGHSFCKFFGLW